MKAENLTIEFIETDQPCDTEAVVRAMGETIFNLIVADIQSKQTGSLKVSEMVRPADPALSALLPREKKMKLHRGCYGHAHQ